MSDLHFIFSTMLKREWLSAVRCRYELIQPLAFFAMVILLFPLGLTPDPLLLKSIAPGMMWIAALLAILLSLDRLFYADYVDGTLEQLLLSQQSLAGVVLAKVLAYSFITAFPLLILSPFLSLLLYLPPSAVPVLLMSLLLGMPTLIFLGAIGAAFTVNLKNNGILLSLLVLPIYIPVLIFGTSAVSFAAEGLSANGQLAWLGVFLLLSICFVPMTVAAILRIK